MMKVAAVTLFLGAAAPTHGIGWPLVNAKVRHDFPNVKRISTAELAAWLDNGKRPPPLVLDVRTRAEFEVSHLRNAEHVEPDAPAGAVRQPEDRAIVTYCSVGYRSAAFAEKLRAAGHIKVVNLEGSIFRWANEGRPVYRGGQTVAEVHPYNHVWGLLLQKKFRSQLPSSAESSRRVERPKEL